GDPQRIVVDIDSAVSFAPDGRRFVFFRYDGQAKESKIITAAVDGSDERVVARRVEPVRLMEPVWSASGREIVTLRSESRTWSVAAFDVRSGSERMIADGWSFATALARGGRKDYIVI